MLGLSPEAGKPLFVKYKPVGQDWERPHPWRYSRTGWKGSWATWWQSSHGRGIRNRWFLGSLPTQTKYNSMRHHVFHKAITSSLSSLHVASGKLSQIHQLWWLNLSSQFGLCKGRWLYENTFCCWSPPTPKYQYCNYFPKLAGLLVLWNQMFHSSYWTNHVFLYLIFFSNRI